MQIKPAKATSQEKQLCRSAFNGFMCLDRGCIKAREVKGYKMRDDAALDVKDFILL